MSRRTTVIYDRTYFNVGNIIQWNHNKVGFEMIVNATGKTARETTAWICKTM